MKNKFSKFLLINFLVAVSSSSFASENVKKLGEEKPHKNIAIKVSGIENNKPIPAENAFCIATKAEKSSPTGKNISPEINWAHAPKETKSFALIVVDTEVPTDFTDANIEGKTIKASLKRQNFYHWVLVNIPANVNKIPAGSGKDKTIGLQGINNYANFMKDKPAENFIGYDGPCPPFNDEKTHIYHFKIFALNTDKLELPENFTPAQAEAEIEKHKISSGEVIGTYSLFKK